MFSRVIWVWTVDNEWHQIHFAPDFALNCILYILVIKVDNIITVAVVKISDGKGALAPFDVVIDHSVRSPMTQGNRMSGRYGLRIARSPFQSSRRVGDSISGTEEIHGIGTCGSRLQSF